jgi:hypothetical protein
MGSLWVAQRAYMAGHMHIYLYKLGACDQKQRVHI